MRLADHLAQDRLDEVNCHCQEVTVRDTIYTRYIKRLIDIVISLIALLVSLPFNLVIGIVTFFDVGRPIFFKQTRIGKDEKPFQIIKFRNMTNARDEHGELLPPAQRVTKFGKFVRRTSLDELLNFWSIFKGDMSLIGPRPLVPEYVHRYSKRHRQRLAVRPGLECPPRKLTGRAWTWQEQFENDVWYVEHVSFLTDLKLIVQLVRFALDPKSSEARASVTTKGSFVGYDLDGNAIGHHEVPQEYIDRYAVCECDKTKSSI